MAQFDAGSRQYGDKGKIYGPGIVEIDDSTPEGDELLQRLEDRKTQIAENEKAVQEARDKQANAFLNARAAAGDPKAIEELNMQARMEQLAALTPQSPEDPAPSSGKKAKEDAKEPKDPKDEPPAPTGQPKP